MTSQTTPAAPATSTPRSTRPLWGALSGIALTVLMFAASPVGEPESLTVEGIRAWLDAHDDAIRMYGMLMALTSVVVVAFVSDLRARMAEVEPGGTRGLVAYGAGLLCATWLLVSAVTSSMLAYEEDLADALVVPYYGLWAVGDMIGSATGGAKAALLLCVSATALRTGFLPRWLGWLGMVLGALTAAGLLVSPFGGSLADTLFYVGMFAFALWPLPVGIVLTARHVRQRRRS